MLVQEYLEDNDQLDQTAFVVKVWPNIKEIYKKPESQQEGEQEPSEEAVSGLQPRLFLSKLLKIYPIFKTSKSSPYSKIPTVSSPEVIEHRAFWACLI